MRADAAEAALIDADLDARDAALAAALAPDEPAAGVPAPPAHPDAPSMTAPWWLDDEQLRDRYRS